jgi:hypothetical protein
MTRSGGGVENDISSICSYQIFTPSSPYGHSPYLICDEQGERIKSAAPNLIPSGALWVSPFSPIASQHRRDTEETIVSEKRD